MKKVVVLAFFALGSVYFIACNRDTISPDSMSVDEVSAATTDSTKKRKPKGDSLHKRHGDSLKHGGKDSLHVKMPKDSLKVKPDSLGHKPKKKKGK
ncbi:MAG: hypothetical protein ACOVO2_05030 [Emticicia sp.]|uniref:hypothetical protein n=1 Tax=Emticicia sp. TaxID=1930953 RepID=UPI003BA7CE96